MSIYSWIQNRSLGLPCYFGEEDNLHRAMYNSLEPYGNSNHIADQSGGIFNLEFSSDGSILVAACEKRSIMLFDPKTKHVTKILEGAHNDCVNCVKFLDSNVFATSSDDSTVALWDVRKLQTKIRSLTGHSNWVKNIEYSKKDELLLTAGFDGTIYTWDINSTTETSLIYNRVFHTSGLMRCRLNHDDTKLVISTTGGYLIIIHDLDLNTLASDLRGFRPNIFRLMQLGSQFIPNAGKFEKFFSKTQKTNRVEFVSDFPKENDAEIVSSLQIHPLGWCAISRNASYDQQSEWTCVHNILDYDNNSGCDDDSSGQSIAIQDHVGDAVNSNIPDIWATEITFRERSFSGDDRRRQGTTGRVFGFSSGITAQFAEHYRNTNNTNAQSDVNPQSSNSYMDSIEESLRDQNSSKFLKTINKKRLLYYVREQNKAKSFIKEICFSSDGRIICSPYGCGIRLLGFTKNCSELSRALNHFDDPPTTLTPITFLKCHKDIVVSTKFSPNQPLLVSGCLQGKIVYYFPRL